MATHMSRCHCLHVHTFGKNSQKVGMTEAEERIGWKVCKIAQLVVLTSALLCCISITDYLYIKCCAIHCTCSRFFFKFRQD